MDDCNWYHTIKAAIPDWKLQWVAEESLEVFVSLAAYLKQVEAPVSAESEDLFLVDTKVFPVAAAHITNKRCWTEGLKEGLDLRPGLISGVAEVRCYLLIHLIHMFLLHVCGELVLLGAWIDFSFFTFTSHHILLNSHQFVLWVA